MLPPHQSELTFVLRVNDWLPSLFLDAHPGELLVVIPGHPTHTITVRDATGQRARGNCYMDEPTLHAELHRLRFSNSAQFLTEKCNGIAEAWMKGRLSKRPTKRAKAPAIRRGPLLLV